LPSNAFTGRLVHLLVDAEQLINAYTRLRDMPALRRYATDALNRAVVVMCISAWEAYVEELVRESLRALHTPVPHAGLTQALNQLLEEALRRFNTPSSDNVRAILRQTIGVPDIRLAWFWAGMTRAATANALGHVLGLRHQIAHGVHPPPAVNNVYASQLPEFFRRLGRRTDTAVRNRLVNHHGITTPWPP
jgi:hypothetical protein